MKLTNPTDDELRHAFAMEVAKYTLSQYGEYFTEAGLFVGSRSTLPPWTESVDAVLPWLEQWRNEDAFDRRIKIDQSICFNQEWWVWLGSNAEKYEFHCYHKVLPKGAVIALLRAHGVEVEFTP